MVISQIAQLQEMKLFKNNNSFLLVIKDYKKITLVLKIYFLIIFMVLVKNYFVIIVFSTNIGILTSKFLIKDISFTLKKNRYRLLNNFICQVININMLLHLFYGIIVQNFIYLGILSTYLIQLKLRTFIGLGGGVGVISPNNSVKSHLQHPELLRERDAY